MSLTLSHPSLDSAFVARALGRREAKRLAALMDGAERQAVARIETAKREADALLSAARAEAEAILTMLPDFAAIEAAPANRGKSAFKAIRDAADAHGLPIAAVTGRGRNPRALVARAQAVRAIGAACPTLSDTEIGRLFSGMSADTVRRIRSGGTR